MRNKNTLIAILFGVSSAAIGLLFLFIFGQHIELTCTRQASQGVVCEKRQSFLGLIPGKEQTLTGLSGAYVEENCDSDGCTYRVMLQTETDDLPLTVPYSSGADPKERVAREINEFVRGSRPTFELQEGPNTLVLLLLGVMLAVDLAVAVGFGARTIIRRMHGY